MLTGGMRLTELEPAQRQELGIGDTQMALLVQHLGQYGAHAAAKRSGLRKGDILVGYDRRDDLHRIPPNLVRLIRGAAEAEP